MNDEQPGGAGPPGLHQALEERAVPVPHTAIRSLSLSLSLYIYIYIERERAICIYIYI